MSALFQVFFSRRMAAVLVAGFASGLPLALTTGTLQAWMAVEKVDLTVIGIFALVGLPYTLKFLWAPVMDRFVPPFLGRRRGWMMVTQILLIGGLAAMAFSDPSGSPATLAVLAFTVAFLSASQDIAVDAYRTEVAKPEELASGAALYIMGYRIAMLVSGALALILASVLSWKGVYLSMAAIMGIGIINTFFAPEPAVKVTPPANLKEAVVHPLVEYFKRRGAVEILFFIVLYKLGDVITSAMTTPFMIQIGFTTADIGAVVKTFGLGATIVGTLIGGALMPKIGMKASLWVFGILQGVSNLAFLFLAQVGHHYPTMVSAIAIENLAGGMGTAAFAAFLMSLCNKKFTATQYALLTSIMAITRVIAGAPTGFMAKNLGWEQYFLVATVLALPGLLFLLRYDRWTQDSPETMEAAAEPATT